MAPEEARLAQIQHCLNVAAQVPDANHPDVIAYIKHVMDADPKELAAKATGEHHDAG